MVGDPLRGAGQGETGLVQRLETESVFWSLSHSILVAESRVSITAGILPPLVVAHECPEETRVSFEDVRINVELHRMSDETCIRREAR